MYRYEVSSYARPGAECRHNLRYWRGGDYLGVGLGAASRIGGLVFNQPREFAAYRELVSGANSAQQWLPPEIVAAPCPPAAPKADSFLRLRTRKGLPLTEAVVDPRWVVWRWVEPRAGWLTVTARGLDFADTLAVAQLD
jgi:coproporphyrinogen III oxidase-like Fe-S oxidoreductase